MTTISRHHHGATRMGYPVPCSYCGVPWPRSKMRRDGSGLWMCPDDVGRSSADLDRLNAARARRQHEPAAADAPIWKQDALVDPQPTWEPGEYVTAEQAAEDVLSPSDFVTSAELVLWLRPGTAAFGTVFTWDDSSQHNNNFIGSGAGRPVITESWLDGHDGVLFDGANTRLVCPSLSGLPAGSKPVVYVVYEGDSTGTHNVAALLFASGADGQFEEVVIDTRMRPGVAPGLGSAVAATVLGPDPGTSSVAQVSWTAPGSADDTPRLFRAVLSNASNLAEVWIDEVLRATASAGAAGGTTYTPLQATLGANLPSWHAGHLLQHFKGVIADVIVFANAPSSAEHAALLAGYFAVEWPTIYAGLP